MKHPSAYLDWYVNIPRLRYDFRSSGLTLFKYDLNLGKIDLSVSHAKGNPEIIELLTKFYHAEPENVFVSSEGASGQNTRIIRILAQNRKRKNEALVEFPTYEPLMRQVQENFPLIKRFERSQKEGYRLNPDAVRKSLTRRTRLVVLTNPHSPSGAVADKKVLSELMQLANEYDFYVLCDEIYAEFDRDLIPPLFSIDREKGIVTTSFTKAYGLGGLKLGTALASKDIVTELYVDVLNTVGNSSNVVQIVAAKLLADDREKLRKHAEKWSEPKRKTEKWLEEKNLQHLPNTTGVTYWVESPVADTYKWNNETAINTHSLAAVPGAFFLFGEDYEIVKSNMIRIGLGAINPNADLSEALEELGQALGI